MAVASESSVGFSGTTEGFDGGGGGAATTDTAESLGTDRVCTSLGAPPLPRGGTGFDLLPVERSTTPPNARTGTRTSNARSCQFIQPPRTRLIMDMSDPRRALL